MGGGERVHPPELVVGPPCAGGGGGVHPTDGLEGGLPVFVLGGGGGHPFDTWGGGSCRGGGEGGLTHLMDLGWGLPVGSGGGPPT